MTDARPVISPAEAAERAANLRAWTIANLAHRCTDRFYGLPHVVSLLDSDGDPYETDEALLDAGAALAASRIEAAGWGPVTVTVRGNWFWGHLRYVVTTRGKR